jgi:hypothetical protein
MDMAVSIEDDLGVRDLYARAVQLFDAGDTAWVQCWADEPMFVFPANEAINFPGITLRSHEELTGMVKQAQQMMEGRGLHHFTNLTFDYADEGVRVRGYLLMVKSGTGPADPSAIMQNSRIEDLVVKTASGWRFKARSVGAIWT